MQRFELFNGIEPHGDLTLSLGEEAGLDQLCLNLCPHFTQDRQEYALQVVEAWCEGIEVKS